MSRLFVLGRRRPSGQLEIIDRVKDIYKNSRGQTVAPRRVEQLFEGVPGIKRTFLAGDGRDDNVLLVVPDPEAPILADLGGDEERFEQQRQAVRRALRAGRGSAAHAGGTPVRNAPG